MPKYVSLEEQQQIDEIETEISNWRERRHEGKCNECKTPSLISNLLNICNECLMKKIYPGGIRHVERKPKRTPMSSLRLF